MSSLEELDTLRILLPEYLCLASLHEDTQRFLEQLGIHAVEFCSGAKRAVSSHKVTQDRKRSRKMKTITTTHRYLSSHPPR